MAKLICQSEGGKRSNLFPFLNSPVAFCLALKSSGAIIQPCFPQHVDDEEELIQQAITDITQLCAENVILWAQFLEAVTLRQEVHLVLAKEHHSMRVSPLLSLGRCS